MKRKRYFNYTVLARISVKDHIHPMLAVHWHPHACFTLTKKNKH